MLYTFWFCFGLITIVNSIILSQIIGDGSFIYPESTREAATLIVVIWGAAYIAGIFVGLVADTTKHSIWKYVGSVVAGYLLATTLHVILLGPFPGTPADSWQVVLDLFDLRPLPTYYTFILMTIVLGPLLVSVATYTGYILANEFTGLRIDSNRVGLYPTVILFCAIAPLTIMMPIIGTLNVCNIDTFFGISVSELCDYDEQQSQATSYQRLVRNANNDLPIQEQQTVPTIIIFYLGLLPNPLVNALLALFCGVLVGLKRTWHGPSLAYSAGWGMVIYIVMMMLLVTVLKPTASTIDFTPIYNDRLGDLSNPDLIIFSTLWAIPALIAMSSAYATHTLIHTITPSENE